MQISTKNNCYDEREITLQEVREVLDLSGKTALVTGAVQGIGFAIAKQLSASLPHNTRNGKKLRSLLFIFLLLLLVSRYHLFGHGGTDGFNHINVTHGSRYGYPRDGLTAL